jgi:hypothetical protein
MGNQTRLTIVNTAGVVLQKGCGGLRLVSEDGLHLMDFTEVSDNACVNVFITQGRLFKSVGFLPKSEDSVSDLEILLPR